jgi:nicotinamidase-related amidase
MAGSKRALILIDVQNDYFPGGKFPLWNTDSTLANLEQAIAKAHSLGLPIVNVRHIANGKMGIAPFFNDGTPGAEFHPRIVAAAPDAKVVVKEFADGFFGTTLEDVLQDLGAEELLICGMMTQNCVTHTAISKSAEKYSVTILPDCCTTVNEMIHNFALRAVSTRVQLIPSNVALAAS